ncbi:hypothetical protein ABHF33_13915 [Chitinibacter sp. FCG-7]|uniref:Peptidase n=1 Tax=Chitinibacter mangrovi TaxID=3153927 RepID=A0AAU7F7W5_9NEIS
MNHDLIIKTTNRVAIYATGCLIYWVFVFLTITIFDLRIFRERMTDMFFLSLLGIFAILGGAIILNVMSNLSKISSAVSASPQKESSKSKTKWQLTLLFISFPLIAACLFIGNELSIQNKKSLLISSAERLISENQPTLALLADYKFSIEFIKQSEKSLNIINKIDSNFPEVMIITPDTIDGKKLFLGFGGKQYHDEKENTEKSAYIYSTTHAERDYLSRVFFGTEVNYRFHSEKGNYQLYFPTTVNGKRMVLYFSDFQRYGKLGS